MGVTKIKPKFKCFGCKRELEKQEFKSKTIQREKVYVCQMCGYYNAPGIFTKK